jgi:hypothetical protein
MHCSVHARLPFLVSIDLPTISNALCSRIHMRHVTAVVDLCQAKRRSKLSLKPPRHKFILLRLRSGTIQHQHIWEIVYNAVFILQVVSERQASAVYRVRGKVEANGAHVKV